MFTMSGSDYEVYLLYKPEQNNEDFVLLACDMDRDKREDRIFSCTLNDIVELGSLSNVHLVNLRVTPSGVFCTSTINQINLIDANIDIPLPSQFTLWDVFELLSLDGAQMDISGNWVPVSRLSFSMKTNKVSYTDYEQHTTAVWTENTSPENIDRVLLVRCTVGRYNWLVNTFASAVRLLKRDQSFVECKIYFDRIPIVCDHSYTLKRFCLAELTHLMNHYQVLRAKLHGIELGNWFMHHVVEDDYAIYSHIKPRGIEQQCGVSFDYQIIFPNAIQFKDNLLADKRALSKLAVAQNDEDFLDIFMQYAGKHHERNIYFEQFAKGFMSQLTTNSFLRDHELLCVECLQQRLTSYAARIFSYKIAMATVPINIPERVELLSGEVVIRRELL